MATPTLGTFLRQLRQAMGAEALAACPDSDLLKQFRSTRDDAAFRALVERHGPMVFRVCRGVLSSPADIEDAFQATFLVLVRRGHTIRRHEALAGWLHGVARRTALKLRTRDGRRRRREARAARPDRAAASDDLPWRELRGVLDEELGRLPPACRAALVLCYLEGRTQDEAAAQLNVSRGSLRLRLARGRELLGRRLARRGVALAAVLSARLISDCARGAQVPRALVMRTVASAPRPAGHVAAPAGGPPPRVAALCDGVIRAMHYSYYKSVAAVLACGLALAAGVYQVGPRPASAQDAKPAAQASAPAGVPDIEPIDPDLVFDPAVQKQLRLSPNQVRRLAEARDTGAARAADQDKRVRDIDRRLRELQDEAARLQKERSAAAQAVHQAQADEVKGAIPRVLSGDAVRQLRQLTLRRMRLSDVLLDPRVRARLDLDDEQVKRIQEIAAKGGTVTEDFRPVKVTGTVYERVDLFWKDMTLDLLIANADGRSRAELLKVLTPRQRQALERLAGTALEKSK